MRKAWFVRITALCGGLLLFPMDARAVDPQNDAIALFNCDVLPAPFDCTLNLPTGDEGVSCPKGDIPYGLFFCHLEETNWLTLYSSSDFEYSYEFRTTPLSLCPNLPQFFGPSSNGVLEIEGSGCPAYEATNSSIAEGGLYASKWCYQYKLFFHKGNGCDITTYSIPMRTVDLVGNDGVCDASDLAGSLSANMRETVRV